MLLPGFPILSPPHSDRFQAPAQNPRQAPKLWKAPASPGLTSITEGWLCFQQHIRASCSHPTPAGALLSTEVPELAPCFHPFFFFPLILGLTWKLSCRSQLCQRVFHSHTATAPRSTLGFYPSPPHRGGSGSRVLCTQRLLIRTWNVFCPRR